MEKLKLHTPDLLSETVVVRPDDLWEAAAEAKAKEAVKWSRKAAEQGDAEAQFNLGIMYHNGQGVPQDHAEAARWYRKAAEQGDADAQFNLGLMYHNGQGVPQDHAEAARWSRKAAEQGHAGAQFNLGVQVRHRPRGAAGPR